MAQVKRYRPEKESKPATQFPTEPLRPKQPSLDGFSTPAIEEMEAAMEVYKEVEEKVKAQRDTLKRELDGAMNKLIAVFTKHGQKAIVINGLSGEIVDTLKAKVKGKKKTKKYKDGERQHEVAGGVKLTPKEKADFRIKVGDSLAEAAE